MTLSFAAAPPFQGASVLRSSSAIPIIGRRAVALQTSSKHRRTSMIVDAGPDSSAKRKEETESTPKNRALFDFSDPLFVDGVSGEWFGYECEFSVRDGSPRNIPERYVPDEYRAWGVEVEGFDSLTSSKCLSDGSFYQKRTRALPSVGCEADAVVPEVSERTFRCGEEAALNGGFSDGSVSCGPATINDQLSQRWQVILADPTEGKRSRVRIEFGLVNEPFGAVTVFLEHWNAPFCNGEILPGCGGSSASFATDKALNAPVELTGKWTVTRQLYAAEPEGWTFMSSSFVLERTSDDARREVNVALPRGISVGITSSEEGNCVMAGWMSSETQRIVVRRTYDSSSALVSVSRDLESKQT